MCHVCFGTGIQELWVTRGYPEHNNSQMCAATLRQGSILYPDSWSDFDAYEIFYEDRRPY